MTIDKQMHEPGRPKRRKMYRWLGWFGMVNAAVLGLVGLLYLDQIPWPDSILSLVYLVLVYVGHHVSLAIVPLFLVVGLLVVFRPPFRVIMAASVVTISLVIGVYVLDGLLWSDSRFHLTALTAQILGWQSWVFTGVIVLIALIFEAMVAARVRAFIERRPRMRGAWVGTSSALALVCAWLIYAWADANYYIPVTRIAERLPVYKGFTAKRSFARLGLVDLERARQRELASQVSDDLADSRDRLLEYPAAPLQCNNTHRFNLLIVMIDSWRFDMLAAETAPNMTAFAQQRGQRFNNHFSGGNSSRSGTFSFFYGLPPGYWSSIEAEQRPAPLVEEFQNQGYEIAIYSSGTLASPVELDRSAFANIQGLHTAEPADAPPWERDAVILAKWQAWLQARDDSSPFFSFLFFDGVTGHEPPDVYPVEFRPSDASDSAQEFSGYQSATHYVDSLMGDVIASLENNGQTEQTVMIITSDHGEEFGESGAGFERHGSGFSRYQLQVPFITAWPGRAPAEFQHRTSHYDVTPTLFSELLGCSNPASDVAIGRNLFDGTGWSWLIAGSYFNYAIVEPDRLTITFPSGNFEVYDWDYHPIDDAAVRKDVLSDVMAANTGFYKK